jgi:hypothetical protein
LEVFLLLRSSAWTGDCFRLLLSFHSLASTSFIYFWVSFSTFSRASLICSRIGFRKLVSVQFRSENRSESFVPTFYSFLTWSPLPVFLGRNFGMRVSCIYLALYNFFSYLQSVCQCENSSLSSVCIVVCKFLIVSFQVLVNLCRVVCAQAVLWKCLSCDTWIEFSFLQFCQESYAIGWGFSAIITARAKCNF